MTDDGVTKASGTDRTYDFGIWVGILTASVLYTLDFAVRGSDPLISTAAGTIVAAGFVAWKRYQRTATEREVSAHE